MTDEFANLDAIAQADLVRRGEVKPIELVDAAIERILRVNPEINAVVTPLFDKARAEAASDRLADGPFRGVPLLLKDLVLQSAGDPYHAGMRLLRDRNWVSDHDTYLATRFRAAGFIFVGKTNVPELGPLPTTEPLAYGPTCNPWNVLHSPGGSSGGSAAAVAAGLVPVAHGNDGGGSIRIPSSACGLVGLKPSRGRNSLGPDNGDMWAGLEAEHVLARSVRDTAAVLDAVSGWMPGDSYVAPPPSRSFRAECDAGPGKLRVGVMASVPAGTVSLHPDCLAAAEHVADVLRTLGHSVRPSHPPALDEAEFGRNLGTVIASWIAHDLDHWGHKTGRDMTAEEVESYTWVLAEMGRGVSAPQYVNAVTWMRRFTTRVAGWWEDGFDLLLTPTMAEPPPPLGELAPSFDNPFAGLARSTPMAVFTSPFNVTGQPAISLPLYWSPAGLPIGIQLVAAYGREDVLIRVAAQLEKAQPWADRRPPVHA